MPDNSHDRILKQLHEKALLKLEVSDKTAAGFNLLKGILTTLEGELKNSLKKVTSRNIPIRFADRGEFEADFEIADDMIVFMMHTNVFTFDNSHEMWKTSYVQQDPSRSYCGKINVYNFLSDSFKFNRPNDIGYLIARIFINKENHFFVDGKRQLGFLYNEFEDSEFNIETAKKVAESAILYSLDFDPYTPPYQQNAQITVQDILDTSMHSKIATGKRLGFRFQIESGEMT